MKIYFLAFVIFASNHCGTAAAFQKMVPANVENLSSIFQKIRMIGSESARPVSNSPFMQEAIDAEAGGRITRCKTGHKKRKLAGGGALYLFKGRHFVITSAHTLYENGKQKCNKNFVHIQPDRHYKKRDGISYKKRYNLRLPPLNHKEASKANRSRKAKRNYIDDFTILEIQDVSLLNSQVKTASGQLRKRQSLELLNIPSDQLVDWGKQNPIRIIGDRKNYRKRRVVVIESKTNCIKKRRRSNLMMHCLDTGAGTSGRPVRSGGNGVIGIHIGGSTKPTSDTDFVKTSRGNSFIPSWYIIKKLEELIENGRL